MSVTVNVPVAATELLTGTIRRRMSGLEVKLKSVPLEQLFSFAAAGRISPETNTQSGGMPALAQQAQTDVFARAGLTGQPAPAAMPKNIAGWGNTRHYLPEFADNGIPKALPGFSLGRFDMWGQRELLCLRNPRFNLSILLAVGLGSEEGMSLVIPTVISPKSLEDYVEGLNASVRQLYIDFLKESTTNIHIITDVYVTS